MTFTKLILALACLMPGMLLAQQAQVTPLMSKDLPDFPGKEGLMITVVYPPGSSDPIHRHNAHAFVYVLEGSIVMQVKGGKETTLTPGQTFYEGPDDIHVIGPPADPSLSHVIVTTSALTPNKSERMIVQVIDNGPGVNNPERIFDEFVPTKEKGMGIGLAVSCSIVDAHGGRLWAVNDPDGRAKFDIALPLSLANGHQLKRMLLEASEFDVAKHRNLRDSGDARFCELCFRLPIDGNIAVGIPPHRQEIPVVPSRVVLLADGQQMHSAIGTDRETSLPGPKLDRFQPERRISPHIRPNVYQLPVRASPLGRKVAISDKWPLAQTLPTGQGSH